MRRVLLPAVLLAVGCGGSGSHDGTAIVARAQHGLSGLGSTPTHLEVRAMTVERRFVLRANQLPKLDLMRWTTNRKRVECEQGLECARADVDVDAALRELRPLMPALPVAPEDIRNAQLDVAVDRTGRTRYLHLHGKLHVTLGDVPFEASLDVPR